MAEEKKTTKKVETKKDAVKAPKKVQKKEEVKVEKRFCTNCGKELKEGEVCSCQEKKEMAVKSVDTEKLKGVGKRFLNTILNMYKKPFTTVEEEVALKDTKSNMLILAAIAISYGLYIMGSFTSILALLGAIGGQSINSVVDIPYFKIFLYVTIINFLLAFIPMAISFVISKIFGGKEYDFKKAISLYTTSMAPTIFSNLLMAVFYYLNILSSLAGLIGTIISLACLFHYILGFAKVSEIKDNRKSYALTSLTVVWIFVQIVVIILFLASFIKDIIPDFDLQDNYNNNYNDVFNW